MVVVIANINNNFGTWYGCDINELMH